MQNAVTMTIGGNSDPLLRVLNEVDKKVKSVGMSGGSAGHHSSAGAINEVIVLMREIASGRGAGRVGSSLTILSQRLGILTPAMFALGSAIGAVIGYFAFLVAGIDKAAAAMVGLVRPDLARQFVAHWDEVQHAIRKTVDAIQDARRAYEGSFEAGNRQIELLKKEFDYRKKILELQGFGANSPQQLHLNAQERAATMAIMQQQYKGMLANAEEAKKRIKGVASPEAEGRIAADLKAAAEEGQKFIAQRQMELNVRDHPFAHPVDAVGVGFDMLRRLEVTPGMVDLVKKGNDQKYADSTAAAKRYTQYMNDAREREHTRERNKEAAAEMERLGVEAEKLRLKMADLRKQDVIQDQRDAVLASLGLQLQGGFSLNAAQRSGAYSATPPDWRRLVNAAVQTAVNTTPREPSRLPPGSKAVQFGPSNPRARVADRTGFIGVDF